MAKNYRAKRQKQQRWKLENKIVGDMLRTEAGKRAHESVFDVPCGEGRFLSLYQELALDAYGVDASETMLKLASRRGWPPQDLETGNATALRFDNRSFDMVVCVRFLDLIPEAAMQQVLGELCRVARRAIVLTIRLGDSYVPKSNTATHDGLKFRALVRKLGWRVETFVSIFNAGWFVIKLVRR
jgi:ubiquinone/menaquinone biosynthesis C-methylase UbiE